MKEFFVDNDGLISHEEWIGRINAFKPMHELVDDEDKMVKELRRLIEDAVKSRIENSDSVGICFSGGLDSSYIAAICKKLKANFRCYTVGFKDGNFKIPDDVTQAALVAESLRLSDEEFKSKLFDLKEIEEIMLKTVHILKDAEKLYGTEVNNVVNAGVAGVEAAAHSISKDEKIFFSGLGSEEIFAGYDRHKRNPTNEECYNGLLAMYDRDLLRDSAIPKALGFNFSTPFLDEELIRYALAIPIKYKLDDDSNKLILRKAAFPLLKEHSLRPKKAAQYGSSFDRAISKLAAMRGYKYKKDYIKAI